MLFLLAILLAEGTKPAAEAVTEPDHSESIPLCVMIFPTIGTGGTLRDPPVTKNVNISLVAGYAARVQGLDLSAGLAWIDEELRGIQIGGAGALIEGEAHGVQIGALFSWLAGDLEGVQISSGVSYARGGEGVQIGLVNVTSKLRGVQAGLVNVGERLDGVPLGLINVFDEGIHDFGFVVSDVSLATLALDLGNNVFYTRWTGGVASVRSARSYVFGAGLGARMSFDPLFVDLAFLLRDVVGDFRDDILDVGSHSPLFTIELAAGMAFSEAVVRLGPTFNVYRAKAAGKDADPFVPGWAEALDDGRTWTWIGFTAGASL